MHRPTYCVCVCVCMNVQHRVVEHMAVILNGDTVKESLGTTRFICVCVCALYEKRRTACAFKLQTNRPLRFKEVGEISKKDTMNSKASAARRYIIYLLVPRMKSHTIFVPNQMLKENNFVSTNACYSELRSNTG